MRSKVYFTKLSNGDRKTVVSRKLTNLMQRAGFADLIQENDLVAIKMHFGETGAKNVVAPHFVKPFVEMVDAQKGSAFLTDTCVLYKSPRADAVNHLKLIQQNGYTLEATGAPVIITDGLLGSSEIEIPIPGKLFDKVSIATEAVLANAMLVLTHVTGHLGTGFGGTLKNLGMGLASRKGKLRQHSGMKPAISTRKCTGCGMCARWCPQNAIHLENDIAVIDGQLCIGCGQCIAVCRFSAVTHDWAVGPEELQKRVAEHALGAIINKREKVGFVNFLTSVTKDCDCLDPNQKKIFPDIGVIASKDPVAVDAAALKLIEHHCGKPLSAFAYPNIDYQTQLHHAASIELGQLDYDIISVDD